VRTLVNKKFLKDLAKLPASDRKRVEVFVFNESENIHSIESFGGFEKLKGYAGYYRVRFGDYRVGVKYEGDVLVFERALHRKEIYRYFP
jgi:mRNA interferase RelE/StbE